MLVVTVSILTFRMLMALSSQLEANALFNPSTAATVGGLLNTLWITLMNVFYRRVAQYLNSRENHRTETEHEDALIIKTFLFQFANSYTALFYIAFIKGIHLSTFGAFGYTDAAGQVWARRLVRSMQPPPCPSPTGCCPSAELPRHVRPSRRRVGRRPVVPRGLRLPRWDRRRAPSGIGRPARRRKPAGPLRQEGVRRGP